ncbi:MAG: hypothetical protein AAF744_04355 [Pseudomonadota bacterium]
MTPEQAARAVMAAHIAALNARDERALIETLHFPHYRLSGTALKIWDTPDVYFADFRARAGSAWARSEAVDIRLQQAAANKVHLDVEIRRFDGQGARLAAFRSLWVFTLEEARWAAKFRSSFAEK